MRRTEVDDAHRGAEESGLDNRGLVPGGRAGLRASQGRDEQSDAEQAHSATKTAQVAHNRNVRGSGRHGQVRKAGERPLS